MNRGAKGGIDIGLLLFYQSLRMLQGFIESCLLTNGQLANSQVSMKLSHQIVGGVA